MRTTLIFSAIQPWTIEARLLRNDTTETAATTTHARHTLFFDPAVAAMTDCFHVFSNMLGPWLPTSNHLYPALHLPLFKTTHRIYALQGLDQQ
jgi:hypothetical protein